MSDKHKIRLLIILNYYPPDLNAAARRWGNLIPELQNNGFDCTIICAGNGSNIEYTGAYGERVIRIEISNIKNSKSGLSEEKKQKSKIKNISKKILYQVVPPIFRGSSIRKWFKQRHDIRKYAANIDYIISSYGPIGPFIFGFWLAKKSGRPWIADVRDSFESRDGFVSVFSRRFSRVVEKYLLKHAQIRITVSRTLGEYLTNAYQTPFYAIYNGWTNLDKIQRIPANSDLAPYIFYGGSIYEHRMSALTLIIHAIKSHPRIRLKIRLLDDYTNGALNLLIERENLSSQIEILPAAPPEIIKFEIAQSLCVLVLEDISNASQLSNGTITGKLLGLLVSGIPGIAISSRTGEIRSLVEKVNGWYGVDTIEECVSAISELKQLKDLSIKYDSLEHYSTKAQARFLADLIS